MKDFFAVLVAREIGTDSKKEIECKESQSNCCQIHTEIIEQAYQSRHDNSPGEIETISLKDLRSFGLYSMRRSVVSEKNAQEDQRHKCKVPESNPIEEEDEAEDRDSEK